MIVWLIVAGALVFMIKGAINAYKGEGGCGCSSSCSGCSGRDSGGACDLGKEFIK